MTDFDYGLQGNSLEEADIVCQNQNFLRGFIFADGQISVISRGLIFAVDKICILKNCFFLFVFK